MHIALNALAALLLGAFGWFALEFVGRPVRKFFDLRQQIKKQMLLHWEKEEAHTIPPPDRADWYRKLNPVRQVFADLAAEMVAFDRSEAVACWFVRLLGFDPDSAGNVLRAIASDFGTSGEERDKSFRRLDAALKFRFDPKRPFYNPYNPGR
jgi:hypothetical protein